MADGSISHEGRVGTGINGVELDLGAFKARLEAARSFEVRLGAITLECVVPEPIDERVAYLRSGEDGAVGIALWRNELAAASVRRWNVRVGAFDPQDKHADAEMPCTPELVRLFFGRRLDVADAVGEELIRRSRERAERLEAAEKNSVSASTGSDPGMKRSD